jgi:hypothetical protein
VNIIMSIHLEQDKDQWRAFVNIVMWIHLAQDRDQWSALVNIVISIHLAQDRDQWSALVIIIMSIHLVQDKDKWRGLVNTVMWIHLARDRDQWSVLVDTVKNFEVPQKFRNSWTAERLGLLKGSAPWSYCKRIERKLTSLGVFMAGTVQTVIFWIVTPYSLVNGEWLYNFQPNYRPGLFFYDRLPEQMFIMAVALFTNGRNFRAHHCFTRTSIC